MSSAQFWIQPINRVIMNLLSFHLLRFRPFATGIQFGQRNATGDTKDSYELPVKLFFAET